jgi:hypothetical protein
VNSLKYEGANKIKISPGDDPVCSFETDWFEFKEPALALANLLHEISENSGVCCGIVGPWGSGKSSFIKLIQQGAKEQFGNSVCFSWFTAWDPGGSKDLGDAMLYRFFQDIKESFKGDLTLEQGFKDLQEALGTRKNFKERASGILNVISKATPDFPGKPLLDITQNVLQEFESHKKVEDAFGKLQKWLIENDKIAFFFVDDLDRASGEQIRDILSEMKVYVTKSRIIGIIAYDDDYVVNSLGESVLPKGTDPRKYLEKIVTLKRQLPVSHEENLRYFAASLIRQVCEFDEETAISIGGYAVKLTSSNARRLKSLILLFASQFSGKAGQYLKEYILGEYRSNYNNLAVPFSFKFSLENAFFIFSASTLGLFANHDILKSFEIGDPALIRYTLIDEKYSVTDSAKIREIQSLLTWLHVISNGADKRLPTSYGVNFNYIKQFSGLPSAMGLCPKMSVDESLDALADLLDEAKRRSLTDRDQEAQLKKREKELDNLENGENRDETLNTTK